MNLKYVELHSQLFLAKKNFQLKLDVNRFQGLKLSYDPKNEWVVAAYEGEVGYIPISNVVCMIEAQENELKAGTKPIVFPQGKIKAQVSAPSGLKIDD